MVAFVNFGSVPSVKAAPDYSESGYFNTWNSTFRVDVNYTDFWTGDSFNYSDFFDYLNATYIQPFLYGTYDWDEPWNYTRNRPAWSWNVPTWSAGDNVSNIESAANYTIYQNSSGYVFYNITGDGGNPYGGGDTYSQQEFSAIFSDMGSGNAVIFVREGTFTCLNSSWSTMLNKENVTIAGMGWDTILFKERPVQANGQDFIFKIEGGKNIILRDFVVDGNVDEWTGEFDRSLSEVRVDLVERRYAMINVNLTDIGKKGFMARDCLEVYAINCISIGSGWNAYEHTWSNNSAIIGCYATGFRDVGYSTWGSHYTLCINSVFFNPIDDSLGANGFGGSWGLMTEATPSTGRHPEPRSTGHAIFRNNIVNNCSSTEVAGRGGGISFMRTGGSLDSYNFVLDNCTFKFSRWQIRSDPLYPGDHAPNIVFYDTIIDESRYRNDTMTEKYNMQLNQRYCWIVDTHTVHANGWVSYIATYTDANPVHVQKWDNYSITIHSQSATNLTFTLEGNSDVATMTTNSTCKIYHTGITAPWKVDFRNGTIASAWDYYNDAEDILTFEFEFASDNEFTFEIYSLGYNTVMLNAPANNTVLTELQEVFFNYTPTFGEAIVNASLWINISGTWQNVDTNSSAVVNNTLNTLNYTFVAAAVYIWNVEVWNSSLAHWATDNFTLTLTSGWTHIIISVSTATKINGVTIAVITKVNTVEA